MRYPTPCGEGISLWEQSLLAMNDDSVCLLNRAAFIASKLCSHN
ncbi:hypothetical protein SAMN04490188_5530 [Pseudomonas kilonensis]|uniref:Uncharacterized protein n=1 Tax=Pseudomonas kilonensis TaxID=132476 RepID=A0ABY0ZIC4_9PSED|nr:hypothetical protein SAMN04490188_5530 [Pseudomonas kilonensis]